jgi:hypothetical protein
MLKASMSLKNSGVFRMNPKFNQRKHPESVTFSSEDRLLVGRVEAAAMLSISRRALDYLVAKKQLTTRRIGFRVLIPLVELKRFSNSNHPDRLAG